MSDWRPIDTAPKDGSRVIVYWPRYAYGNDEEPVPYVGIGHYKTNSRIEWASTNDRGKLLLSYFSDNYELDDYGLSYPEHAATHWMPLPAPPTTDSTS